MQVGINSLTKPDKSAGEELNFDLKNVDSSLANALRRVLLAEVPSIAIDHATVLTNTSVLFDEMIVHRLGLVPLWAETAVDRLRFPRECPCNGAGCSGCHITGRLTVSCPATHHEHKRDVYASDLIFDADDVYPVSHNEKGVHLLTLGRGQEIDITFKVRKGVPKEHAKWMTTGTVAMHYEMDVHLFPESFERLEEDERVKWVERCPAKVFEYDERDALVKLVAPKACIYCKECLSIDPPYDKLPEPLVTVRPMTNAKGYHNFTFKIESTGSMPVLSILFRALGILENKLKKIQKELREGDRGMDIPTRAVGNAPTGPRVVNQDAIENETQRNKLAQFNYV